MADADAERALLSAVAAASDSGFDSSTLGWDSAKLVGLVKSLEAAEMITVKARRSAAACCCAACVVAEPSALGARRLWITTGGW